MSVATWTARAIVGLLAELADQSIAKGQIGRAEELISEMFEQIDAADHCRWSIEITSVEENRALFALSRVPLSGGNLIH